MASPPPSVVPAQLGFLAIYNPTLGANDDTIEDQLVYYASVGTPQSGRRRRARNRSTSAVSQEERNERLRQIGLAQGMVEFGRSFSGDRPVDTVETEKSRVIMHELEPGWWILASIDLTRLPAQQGKQASSSASKGKGADPKADAAEYSSREVKPSALLLQDLMRAHSVFLLHHDSSLSSLFVRTKRTKFSHLIGSYWDMFLSTWNVMLHGNPIVNVFRGIKVAASGELGIGVGEEERGSGEREVLEGLIGRIEGLVDLVVSKFGDYNPESSAEAEPAAAAAAASMMDPTKPLDKWLGTGAEPAAEDGAIFLGTGALSRHSLRNLTHWMEDIYSFGENAYGVRESATSTRRTRTRRKSAARKQALEPVMLPPPPVTELARRAKQASPTRKSSSKPQERAGPSPPAAGSAGATPQGEPDSTGMAKYVDYLKMGYGKYWSIGGTTSPEPTEEPTAGTVRGSSTLASPDTAASGAPIPKQPPQDESSGHYLIGLMGDVQGTAETSDDDSAVAEDPEHNSRTLLRTVTVELDSPELERSESQTMKDLGSHDTELFRPKSYNDESTETVSRPGTSRTGSSTAAGGGGARRESFNSQDRNKTHKLRIVIYVNRPFMFAFLFRLRTDSLAWDGLYKSLHSQLAPLRRPLLSSTSYRPERPGVGGEGVDGVAAGVGGGPAVIYDLVWDPNSLTIHSTIPSVPDPAATSIGGSVAAWSRVEALNTHTQMLNTYIATRHDRSELERTCKTSRGWWVVWNRVTERETAAMRAEAVAAAAAASSNSSALSDDGSDSEGRSEETTKPDRESLRSVTKEIFLIRKASDHPDAGSSGTFRNVSNSYGAGNSGRWADGASRLAQGIGVDTRKYVESLINMNR
ncbi:hypothetical protein GGTG_00394 [Gaeumannomyces tritici R3-111a-1]|uniref:CCZ1/INTU/HSP4 first Longin domain-containing protein n=1 Tax=Gaeumannomyces tritici (strain R3-111a-1) TaxID=644352 RepID=J3NGK4_GAET3|nr:hypothetical protein GGTG_00394 [Gaeumannomyces tritici R3-111a-1]EJT80394.1 hypothetical protein GGTG_00394 [Gaeumannomyces tritici R3-111a-1]